MRVRVTVFDLHLLFLSQCQSQTAIIFPTRMSSLCHARKAKPVNLHHLRPMEPQAQDPMHQSSTKSYRSWSISWKDPIRTLGLWKRTKWKCGVLTARASPWSSKKSRSCPVFTKSSMRSWSMLPTTRFVIQAWKTSRSTWTHPTTPSWWWTMVAESLWKSTPRSRCTFRRWFLEICLRLQTTTTTRRKSLVDVTVLVPSSVTFSPRNLLSKQPTKTQANSISRLGQTTCPKSVSRKSQR